MKIRLIHRHVRGTGPVVLIAIQDKALAQDNYKIGILQVVIPRRTQKNQSDILIYSTVVLRPFLCLLLIVSCQIRPVSAIPPAIAIEVNLLPSFNDSLRYAVFINSSTIYPAPPY